MGRYAGKYRRKRSISLTSWGMILAAVLSLMIGSVVAYLSTSTGAVSNTFTADAATDPAVMEDFTGDVKSNVAVDVGKPGYAVYVRAAIVVTWKDQNGNVYGMGPVASPAGDPDAGDYIIELGEGWFKGSDGFYYYEDPVAYDGNSDSSKLTASLIESCKPVDGKAPEGYGLNVEIIAQTIQAVGTTDEGGQPAVTDAWGVKVVDGKLTPDS